MEQGERGGGEDGVREVHLKKKKRGGTTCPNTQMRSGRGHKDRGEGVEANYMITNNIFATEEVTTVLVRHCSQPAILLSHSSKRSELKACVQPYDGDLIHNALTSWLMTLRAALRRKKICSNKRFFNVRE